jgi:hypothetical protein
LANGVDRLAKGLLQRTFRNEEKTFAGGYYLQPAVMRYDGQIPLQDEPDRPCTFINFPYLCLEEPTEMARVTEEIDPLKRKFPVRSLLQSRYRLRLTHENDLEQSIASLKTTEVNRCIQPASARLDHVANAKCSKIVQVHQLWCVSLSGGNNFVLQDP